MQQLITVLHLLISILVIGIILIQRGKGAEMGASFGGGAGNSMFGGQGATPFLVKLTTALAILFFVSSSILSFIVSKQNAARVAGLPFLITTPKKEQAGLIPVAPELRHDAPQKDKSH